MLSARRSTMRRQSGVMLLEALIGILIFSLGILGLVGLQAATVSAAADARYRAEASNFANQLIARMWINVDRMNLATALESFRYNVAGSDCSFSGGATDGSNTVLANWIAGITSAGVSGLPGATTSMQQVLVDTSAGANNLVTVTVCWRAPTDTQPHRHVVSANIL